MLSLAERLWRSVPDRGEGCWLWTGQVTPSGYGHFTHGPSRRRLYAHRVSLELALGHPIPKGRCAMHACDNPPCVNPAHLRLGTQRENNADKVAKRRHVFGERAPTAKLTELAVRELRAARAAGATMAELAAAYGISSGHASAVVRGECWAHSFDGVAQVRRRVFVPRGGRRGPTPVSVRVRVEQRIDKSGECWLWTGTATPAGYGMVGVPAPGSGGGQRPTYVHRLMYEWHHGEIPAGKCVGHRCHNPRCVNPAHLYAATLGDIRRAKRAVAA